MRERLLELVEIHKTYRGRRRLLQRGTPFVALDGVSLTVHRGEVVGLVGESGCGKSTLAQVAIRLLDPDSGSVSWQNANVTRVRGKGLRDFRRGVQMVFQDTGSSLNPRKTVKRHLSEVSAVAGKTRARSDAWAEALLRTVGLDPTVMGRLPHQLSGGQRQRLGIARALAMEPDLIIADEPVASLDVSLQAQIVNLLDELRRKLGLSMLFISHDLALVAQISDRVVVMFAGTIVEEGAPEQVLRAPSHPYTQALLAAIPRGIAGAGRPRLVQTEATSLPDIGCRFRLRCPLAAAQCLTPPLPRAVAPEHSSRCHFAGGVARVADATPPV